MRQPARAAESRPASRRFESSLLHRSHKRTCALTIITEAGAAGTGLSLYLDGNPLARIKSGEALTVYLTPRSHFLSIHPLFSPKVGQLVDLRSGDPATVRIVDRDGNYQFSVATRGLFSPPRRIVSGWGEQPVTHPHADE